MIADFLHFHISTFITFPHFLGSHEGCRYSVRNDLTGLVNAALTAR